MVSLLSYGQQGEISYKSIFVKGEDSKTDTEFAQKIIREVNLMTFLLSYNKSESFFEKLPHIPFDNFSAKLATVTTNSVSNWYQDPSKKQSYYNWDIKGKTYLVVYENKMGGWKLLNETKKIENYTCYKAVLREQSDRTLKEYDVIAWYTPEIPVPYGPIGYGGLPGLILELKYKQAIFIADKITLNPKNGIKDYPLADRKNIINNEELVKLMRASRKVTPD